MNHDPATPELQKSASEILQNRAGLMVKRIGKNDEEIATNQRGIARLEEDNLELRHQIIRLTQAAWLLDEQQGTLDERFAAVEFPAVAQ